MTLAVAAPAPAPRLPPRSVVLVTLDGTRWQDVFLRGDETMPTLHRWATGDGVALGAPGHGEVWASGPNYVSMPGYTEIFTGRPSACQSNECGPIATPTIVDEVQRAGEDAAVVSSWERIALTATDDPARVVLSAGRHATGRVDRLDPALLAESASSGPWPGGDDYRPDALTAALALRLVESAQPRFLFVGLGDTDEHAHHGDRPAYVRAMRDADRFLGDLEERVGDRTVIVVTTDHGRSDGFRDHGQAWPESGRTWIVAHGAGLDRGAIDGARVRLADVAPTVRCLLGLEPDDAPDAGRALPAICDE